MKFIVIHCLLKGVNGFCGWRLKGEFFLFFHVIDRGRHFPFEVSVIHGKNSGEQISQIIGKVGVYTLYNGIFSEIGIQTEHHLPHQEISEWIHSIHLSHLHRIGHVTNAFGHLAAPHIPEAMNIEVLICFNPCGFEHDRPVDTVGLDDILGHKVLGNGPEFFEFFPIWKSKGGDIVT